MSGYDLIAFDMDGTLLDDQKQVTPRVLSAIFRAYDQGKNIVLCSGRCLSELACYREQLSCVRYLITTSGAMVYDVFKQQVIAGSPIDPNTIDALLSISGSEDTLVQLMTTESIIDIDKSERSADYNMLQYRELHRKTSLRIPDLYDYYRRMRPTVYKCNISARTEAIRLRLFEQITKLPVTAVYSETTTIECSPAGVSKATGLEMLCRRIGIPIERTIAVGDGNNDLEVIRAAGLGIAMGNANQDVKNASDVIVADNNHDGAAEAIEKYLLD